MSDLPARLTERQLNVMKLTARGMSRADIAKALRFTENVIGNDLREIRHKLHSRTTTEAAVKLAKARLI